LKVFDIKIYHMILLIVFHYQNLGSVVPWHGTYYGPAGSRRGRGFLGGGAAVVLAVRSSVVQSFVVMAGREGGLLKVLLLRLIRIINFVSKLRGLIHILPPLMFMLRCCSHCYCCCCLFRGKHPTHAAAVYVCAVWVCVCVGHGLCTCVCVYLLFPFMFIHWIYDIIVAYFAAPSLRTFMHAYSQLRSK